MAVPGRVRPHATWRPTDSNLCVEVKAKAAHDLALVVGVLSGRLAALDRGDDPLGHHRSLEVCGGARLRERQVRRVAEGEDVRTSAEP